jgi:hypothetical protein
LTFGNDSPIQPILGDDVPGHCSGLISRHDTGTANGLALAPGILNDIGFGAGGLDAQDEAFQQGVTNFEDSGSRLDGIDEAGGDPVFHRRLRNCTLSATAQYSRRGGESFWLD